MGQLEEFLAHTIRSAGGKIEYRKQISAASFDEQAIGVWITVSTVLESIIRTLDSVSNELYGYTLLLGKDIPDHQREWLCRSVIRQPGKTRIWCDPVSHRALQGYISFESTKLQLFGTEYIRIAEFDPPGMKNEAVPPAQDFIQQTLNENPRRNILFRGPPFIGKRAALYRCCAPRLRIRFSVRRTGPCCYADAMDQALQDSCSGTNALTTLTALVDLIYHEQLRSECSAIAIRHGKEFLSLLLETVIKTCDHKPVLILEDLQHADSITRDIFTTVWNSLPDSGAIRIYGSYSATDPAATLSGWESVFPVSVSVEAEFHGTSFFRVMPPDLWELAYFAYLLMRYFPRSAIPDLFAEEGINQQVRSRAFKMLVEWGLCYGSEDPVPHIPDFELRAEVILGDGRWRIQKMVRNRLKDWVLRGKIRPCYELLEIIKNLGGESSDDLVLQALYNDVIDGTFRAFESSLGSNYFERVTGTGRKEPLQYLFNTLRALVRGSEGMIRDAFTAPVPEKLGFKGFRVAALEHRAAFYMGIRDYENAWKAVKEAILIQHEKNVAPAYRLCALIHVAKQQVDDAVEYANFAVEMAGQFDQIHEIGISLYYSAVVRFLQGNISEAERLIARSVSKAMEVGSFEWADRSRFFQARLRFETGHYQDSLLHYQRLQENPASTPSKERILLISAWMDRARAYAGYVGAPTATEGDAALFAIEAAYLNGDYQQAAFRAEQIIAHLPDTRFLYTEQPDWSSGFAQCETFAVDQKDLWYRFATVYRALALCRLPDSASRDQAVLLIRGFMENESFSDLDPNAIFYFYAYYRILRESKNASEADINGVISQAFRRLRQKMNMIDDPETKKAFFMNAYWNSALCQAAKEYRLF